uniref:NR LBD domain-containing protein n=1 Tax=Haemonchus placei TaxID=6290 RepID=A0A0N4W8C1_HAEPC
LKPLNYKEYVGLNKADFIMLYDYAHTGRCLILSLLESSKEDRIKYKSIVPWKAALWSTLVVPFHELDIKFEEFCILKALTCWHISGRRICDRQRNLLIECLFDICEKRGNDPSERVGNLILFISCVFVGFLRS